ncbi:MAG: 1-acyl-sn-glycerol-3-phosphate acyltransferase [Bacteroidales bacterium]|nr:1-acyl-sn-glycerol-3-phosphate acyltransferase [Bacteroidales bacterium]
MLNADKYKTIRPYNDDEVEGIIEQLLKETQFTTILSFVYPQKKQEEVISNLKKIKTVKDFQRDVVYYYLNLVVQKTISKLTYSGIERLNPSKNYIFMSNHRDIVLDPALINIILFDHWAQTSEIAIGSNLLILPWIEMLVKLNKTFVVQRNLPAREMLLASQELSSYIKDTIDNNSSIWIAQKEGRTKDGNDKTHPALLKMLSMSSEKSLIKSFRDLRIVPVSISYEYEPCDKSKINELYSRFKDGDYKKNPQDDLNSMSRGLNNFKGRVHISFGRPLRRKLNIIKKIENKHLQFDKIAQLIDSQIYRGCVLFTNNFIAYDLLFKTDTFRYKYTQAEVDEFTNYLKKQTNEIEGEKKIIDKMFLALYANPVINKHKLRQLPVSFL